jgi:hypothetical protein
VVRRASVSKVQRWGYSSPWEFTSCHHATQMEYMELYDLIFFALLGFSFSWVWFLLLFSYTSLLE